MMHQDVDDRTEWCMYAQHRGLMYWSINMQYSRAYHWLNESYQLYKRFQRYRWKEGGPKYTGIPHSTACPLQYKD